MASGAGDLDGQIDGETKGVVQLKGDIARKHSALGKRCQGLVQVHAAVVERRGEALLLGGNDTLDERDVLEQLGIGLAHLSVDLVDELGQEGASMPSRRPWNTARRSRRRRTYSRPSLPGRMPSEIIKSTAREWSAMMRREQLAPE